jgi:hypothetical protein
VVSPLLSKFETAFTNPAKPGLLFPEQGIYEQIGNLVQL